MTPPTGLGLLASLRGGALPGRAAHGPVAPRKMACRLAAGSMVFHRFKAINSRTGEGQPGRCPFQQKEAPCRHEMAVIRGRIWSCSASYQPTIGGQIMQTLTGAQVFAAPKRARRSKDWFERARLVVAAARDRAVETARQRPTPSMKPTVLQRRRLAERLNAKS